MTASDTILRTAAPAAVPSTHPWRAAFGNLSTVLCAVVLALGLAGCGGGGGGGGGDDPATKQRDAIKEAIQDAKTAVDRLTDISTAALLRVAENAVKAAKMEVANAGELSDQEKKAYDTAISVIEGVLETAQESITMSLGDEVGKLTMALTGDRIEAVSATVELDAALTMGGTVPGTPATTVTGLKTTAVEGSASSADGWTDAIYTATDQAAGITDEVVFYTDIEAPGRQPFSGDTGKYGTADGIDADGNLEIGSATDATLIASDHFPTGPGIVTHEAGAGGVAEVAGTFDGAPGTYMCTPAADHGCTSSIRSGGGIALAGGGGWKFVPAAGATVEMLDTQYRYFGWWLRNTGDSFFVGVFDGGVGGDAQDFADLPRLQGTATYSGPATGKFVIDPPLSAAEAGEFTAEAELEVDFGDDSALGTVKGTVDGFVVNGDVMEWSVELQPAAIAADGTVAADSGIETGVARTARTVWSIDGQPGGATGSWTWRGQLHDVDETKVPNVATGTFEATYDDFGSMAGAFGTTRE